MLSLSGQQVYSQISQYTARVQADQLVSVQPDQSVNVQSVYSQISQCTIREVCVKSDQPVSVQSVYSQCTARLASVQSD